MTPLLILGPDCDEFIGSDVGVLVQAASMTERAMMLRRPGRFVGATVVNLEAIPHKTDDERLAWIRLYAGSPETEAETFVSYWREHGARIGTVVMRNGRGEITWES